MSMQADETRTAKLLSPDREQKLGPEKCLSVPSWKTIFWVVFVLFIITIVILLIIGINSEVCRTSFLAFTMLTFFSSF